MIDFKRFELENGLKVIIHQDKTTPIVAVNLAYDVGARDEDPELTGLAHYFEHLMFSGSKNAPDYDKIVQKSGGQNNAFTSNDYTNYYISLPKSNLEVALWLEADRMQFLNVDEKSLEVQRQVVIEEFKQRYLNQPYGNNLANLRKITFLKHPYQWATIGKSVEHIERVTLDDALAFYKRFYAPNNCILTICGDVEIETSLELIKKYFGGIPASEIQRRERLLEDEQISERFIEVEEDVPLGAFLWSFKVGARTNREYPVADLMSDILGKDESSLLHQKLVVEFKLLNQVGAYVSGDRDPGMMVISGKLNKDVSFLDVEREIWGVLTDLQENSINEVTLQKVKNKYETAHVFGELSVLNKAMNLAYHELCGDVHKINTILKSYEAVTADDVHKWVKDNFQTQKVCRLHVVKSNQA